MPFWELFLLLKPILREAVNYELLSLLEVLSADMALNRGISDLRISQAVLADEHYTCIVA